MKTRWQGVFVLLLLLDGSLPLQAWPMLKGDEHSPSKEAQKHEKLTTEEARFREERSLQKEEGKEAEALKEEVLTSLEAREQAKRAVGEKPEIYKCYHKIVEAFEKKETYERKLEELKTTYGLTQEEEINKWEGRLRETKEAITDLYAAIENFRNCFSASMTESQEKSDNQQREHNRFFYYIGANQYSLADSRLWKVETEIFADNSEAPKEIVEKYKDIAAKYQSVASDEMKKLIQQFQNQQEGKEKRNEEVFLGMMRLESIKAKAFTELSQCKVHFFSIQNNQRLVEQYQRAALCFRESYEHYQEGIKIYTEGNPLAEIPSAEEEGKRSKGRTLNNVAWYLGENGNMQLQIARSLEADNKNFLEQYEAIGRAYKKAAVYYVAKRDNLAKKSELGKIADALGKAADKQLQMISIAQQEGEERAKELGLQEVDVFEQSLEKIEGDKSDVAAMIEAAEERLKEVEKVAADEIFEPDQEKIGGDSFDTENWDEVTEEVSKEQNSHLHETPSPRLFDLTNDPTPERRWRFPEREKKSSQNESKKDKSEKGGGFYFHQKKMLVISESPTPREEEEIKKDDQNIDLVASRDPSVKEVQRNFVLYKDFLLAIKNNPSATRFIAEKDQGNKKLAVSNSVNLLRLFFQSQGDKEKNQEVAMLLHNALCEEYQEQGNDALNFIHQQFLGDNTANWSSDKIRHLIQVVDEKIEPTLESASISFKDWKHLKQCFGDFRIIDQFSDSYDENKMGKNSTAKKEVTILKANSFQYPCIRIEKGADQQMAMAGDHLLVTLKIGEESEAVRRQIGQQLGLSIPIELKQMTPYGPFYRLYFKFHYREFSKILTAVEKLGISCSPNILSSVKLDALSIPDKDEYYDHQWNLHGDYGVKADQVWNNLIDGLSPTIAIIDTGIHDKHEDFKNQNQISYVNTHDSKNFIEGEEEASIEDKDGHGTHCGGIAAAVRFNKKGIAGITSGSNLVALKVCNKDKDVTFLDEAISYAIEHACHIGVEFLSCSLSPNGIYGGIYEIPAGKRLLEALRLSPSMAELAGHAPPILVVSAGNDGKNINHDQIPRYPASFAKTANYLDGIDNLIVVAATDRRGQLAFWSSDEASNFGKETVHLAAPGTDIWSTYVRKGWTLGLIKTNDNAYQPLSGTSMAAPHVTAALALMRRVFPLATAKELVDRLLATTDPIPTLDTNDHLILNEHTIAGRLNLVHALRKDLLGTFGEFSGFIYPLTREQNRSSLFSQAIITLRRSAEEKGICAYFLKEQARKEKAMTEAVEGIRILEKLVEKSNAALNQAPAIFRPWWQQELNNAQILLNRWNRRLERWEEE